MGTWKRELGTLLLLLWIAVLVFGAWPPNLRPRLLDPVHDLAVRTLRLFGMSAGQPLFQTDASPWKQYGYCLFVRGTGAGANAPLLYPPGGECRIEGFHPRLPPVARATHRMLSSAWKLRNGTQEQRAQMEGYLAAMGRAFCLQSQQAGRPLTGIEAVWIWYYKHYDNGRVLRQNGLYFDYACEDGRLGEVVWHPDDDAVVARWGEEPW